MALHKQNAASPRNGAPESQSAGPASADLLHLKDETAALVIEFQEKLQQTLHAFKLKAAKQVVQDLPKITGKLIERSAAGFEELAVSASGKLREELKAAQTEFAEESRRQLATLGEEAARSFQAELKTAAEASLADMARSIDEQAQAASRNTDDAVRSVLTVTDDAAARLEATREELESSLLLDHQKRLVDLAASGRNAGALLNSIQTAANEAAARLDVACAEMESSLIPDHQKRLAELSATAQELDRKVQAGVEDFQGQLESTLSQFKRKAAARIEEDLSKTSTELLQHSAERLQKQTDEARERLLADLRDSGTKVLEETGRQLAGLGKASSEVLNQSARAAADKAVSHAAQRVEEQAQTAFERSAAMAIARIEAEQQKLQTRAELSVADHQKQLLQLSVHGVEGIQRQLDGHLEAFRGQLQTHVHVLEQKALERATEDFPRVAAGLVDGVAASLQKKAAEAAAGAQETVRASAAGIAEETRRQVIEGAEDSLRSLREAAMEQTRGQLRQLVKDEGVAHRKDFEEEIAEMLRKRRKSIQQQIDEASRASLERLQQASARVTPGLAPQTSYGSKWVLILVALIPTVLFIYLMNRPVMRLKAEPPADFVNAYPEWTAQHQDEAVKLGEAYWDWAALHLVRDYPDGTQLPEQPPVSFEVNGSGFPSGVEADVARMRYWNKLRELWTNPQSWDKIEAWNRH